MIELSEGIRNKICKVLLEYDPDIVEIVQFGSSVYAPEYAKDVDLLVITNKRKDYGVYLDATAEIYDELDFPYNIDVVPHEIGDKLRKDFITQVFGSSEVIYGDGSYLKGLMRSIDPSFREARAALSVAKDYLNMGRMAKDEDIRDMHIRNAFDGLFHAARIASMVFLAIESVGWGEIKKKLPQPYRSDLETFIRTLHIDYFYNGNYPENYENEFERWHRRVQYFIRRLEKMK